MPDGRIRTAGSEVNSATPPPITIREDSLWAFVMNYSHPKPSGAGSAVPALPRFFPLTCQDSLPTYAVPANIMSFEVKTIEQLSNRIAPPGRQLVHMVL